MTPNACAAIVSLKPSSELLEEVVSCATAGEGGAAAGSLEDEAVGSDGPSESILERRTAACT
eukprot:1949036-Pyramimonas_sp.AAC.1